MSDNKEDGVKMIKVSKICVNNESTIPGTATTTIKSSSSSHIANPVGMKLQTLVPKLPTNNDKSAGTVIELSNFAKETKEMTDVKNTVRNIKIRTPKCKVTTNIAAAMTCNKKCSSIPENNSQVFDKGFVVNVTNNHILPETVRLITVKNPAMLNKEVSDNIKRKSPDEGCENVSKKIKKSVLIETFECPYCCHVIPSVYEVLAHVNQEHSKVSNKNLFIKKVIKYRCIVCYKIFSSQELLEKHSIQHASTDSLLPLVQKITPAEVQASSSKVHKDYCNSTSKSIIYINPAIAKNVKPGNSSSENNKNEMDLTEVNNKNLGSVSYPKSKADIIKDPLANDSLCPVAKNDVNCKFCTFGCASAIELHVHMKSKHLPVSYCDQLSLYCSMCSFSSWTPEKLKDHLFSVHKISVINTTRVLSRNTIVSCNLCKIRFPLLAAAKNHICSKTTNIEVDNMNIVKLYCFICKICNTYLSCAHSLKAHMDKVHNCTKFQIYELKREVAEFHSCRACCKLLVSDEKLLFHCKQYCHKLKIGRLVYHCNDCRFANAYKSKLKAHIIQKHIHSKAVKIVSQKPAVVKMSDLLINPNSNCGVQGVRNPSKVLEYKCSICNSIFKTVINFCLHNNEKHVIREKTVNDKVIYECENCTVKLFDHVYAKHHICMKTDDEENPNVVQIVKFRDKSCNLSFFDRKKGDKHNIYTGTVGALIPVLVKMHHCKVCYRLFDTDEHLKLHCQESKYCKTGRILYQCKFCYYSDTNKLQFIAHYEYEHDPDGSFDSVLTSAVCTEVQKCKHCDFSTISKSEMLNHKQISHKHGSEDNIEFVDISKFYDTLDAKSVDCTVVKTEIEEDAPETIVNSEIEDFAPETVVKSEVEEFLPETIVKSEIEDFSPETIVKSEIEEVAPETEVEELTTEINDNNNSKNELEIEINDEKLSEKVITTTSIKYRCQECNLIFVSDIFLSIHMQTKHNLESVQIGKETITTCNNCNLKFVDYLQATNHFCVSNNSDNRNVVDISAFNCHLCSFISISNSACYSHMITKHVGSRKVSCTILHKHRCSICYKLFDCDVELQKHCLSKDKCKNGRLKFQCLSCDYSHSSSKVVKKHSKNVHQELNKHLLEEEISVKICDNSKFKVKDFEELTINTSSEISDLLLPNQLSIQNPKIVLKPVSSANKKNKKVLVFQCSVCHLVCLSRKSIQEHTLLKMKCMFCGLKFCDVDLLSKHIRSKHRLSTFYEDLDTKVFHCKCSLSFAEMSFYYSHKCVKMSEPVDNLNLVKISMMKCLICNKPFFNDETCECYPRPELVPSTTVMSRCWVCYRIMPEYDLELHCQSEECKNGIILFQCTKCQFQIASISKYKLHMKEHENSDSGSQTTNFNDTVNECQIKSEIELGDEFLQKNCTEIEEISKVQSSQDVMQISDKKNRVKSISKIGITCNFCKLKFISQTFLAKHLEKCHSNVVAKPTLCRCLVCNEEFSNNDSLQQHLKTKHKRFRKCGDQFQCESCQALVSHLKLAVAHVCSRNDKFYCHFCNYNQDSKSSLQNHIENEHLNITSRQNVFCEEEKNSFEFVDVSNILIKTENNLE